MSSNVRQRSALSRALAGRGLAIAVAGSVGACSADVTRFDFPAFNLSDSDASTGALPSSYAPPGVPPRGVGATNEPPAPIYGASRPGGYQAERVASGRDWASENTSLPPLVPEHRPAATREPTYTPERPRPAAAPVRSASKPRRKTSRRALRVPCRATASRSGRAIRFMAFPSAMACPSPISSRRTVCTTVQASSPGNSCNCQQAHWRARRGAKRAASPPSRWCPSPRRRWDRPPPTPIL